MVKTLLCGSVSDDSWELLVNRLEEVQKSPQGPFEVLFLTTPFAVRAEVVLASAQRLAPLEIKIYGFARDFSPDFASFPDFLEIRSEGVGLFNAHKNLTVAFALQSVSQSVGDALSAVREITAGPGYRGCDLLLSELWPRGCGQCLGESDAAQLSQCGLGVGSGSTETAQFAALVRPRYHAVGGLGVFYQRPPYENPAQERAPRLFTRLLAIDAVSTAKEKSKKWIHALNITPIIYMKLADIEDAPADATDFPYAGPLQTRESAEQSAAPPAKRFKGLETEQANPSSFFFQGSAHAQGNLNLTASSDAKTLFIGGLGRETNEQELRSILLNVVSVRRPPGKGFAFVQFTDHESARRVLEGANRGKGLVVQNRRLSVGWSSEKEKTNTHDSAAPTHGGSMGESQLEQAMRERLLIPPTEDSKQLFIGNLPSTLSSAQIEERLRELFANIVSFHSLPAKKSFVFAEFESFADAMAVVTRSINETIRIDGQPLVVGWAKPTACHSLPPPPYSDCRVLFLGGLAAGVSAKDTEDLCAVRVFSIRRPEGRDYAFIEFYTSEDASRCGERLIAESATLCGARLKVGWAQGRPADKHEQSNDCWFCLASPSLKAHLIVSVGKHNYLAIPRGGVSEKHLIVCPIDCLPNRLHLSAESKLEQQRFCESVEKLFRLDDCAMLVFERALRTKGSRDHMQLHLVPIPFALVNNVMAVFKSNKSNHGLVFHELQEDESVENAVISMEGGPYQEFFYVELPVDSNQPALKRRFVYVHSQSSPRFHMFFGNELAARAINHPERANWKNCVLSEDAEAQQVEKIRESFSPFDFTLEE